MRNFDKSGFFWYAYKHKVKLQNKTTQIMQEVFDNWQNRLLNKDIYPYILISKNAA